MRLHELSLDSPSRGGPVTRCRRRLRTSGSGRVSDFLILQKNYGYPAEEIETPLDRKILFKWSEILAWMGESSALNEKNAAESFDGGKITETSHRAHGDNYRNLINI